LFAAAHADIGELSFSKYQANTPYDIQAAGKAGVRVIAVRSGGFSDSGLKGALAIYDDPADLLAHYESSPLVR
jgi:hypothetical protein